MALMRKLGLAVGVLVVSAAGEAAAFELPEEAVRGRDFAFCNVGSNSGIYAFDWESAGVKGLSLATSPQSINLGFELLERYADRLAHGCTVFIPICPFSSIARSRAESKWKSSDSRPDVEKNPVTPEAFRQSVEMLLKCWREEFDITDFAAPLSERNRRTFKAKVKVLREGLEMCIRKGWRPVLVMPPVSRYYDAVFTDKVWRQYVDDFVAAAHVDGVPYWDYGRDERFRDDSNFFNSLMMSRKGAAAFTAELLRRIKVNEGRR